jgi:hypothetical protein
MVKDEESILIPEANCANETVFEWRGLYDTYLTPE